MTSIFNSLCIFFVHRNKIYLIFFFSIDTSEEMLVFLVRYFEGHLAARGKDELLTLLPLHCVAPGLHLDLAHGLADRLALGADHSDLLLLLEGEEVEQGLGVIGGALPRGHLLRDHLLHEAAVLPRNVAAVVVTQPYLHALLVHIPLGVALLLSHDLAHGHVLDLGELLCGPGLADLLREFANLDDVISDGFRYGAILAVHVTFDLAVVDGDLDAVLLLPLDAPVDRPEGAHLHQVIVKVQRSKSRNVNTAILNIMQLRIVKITSSVIN